LMHHLGCMENSVMFAMVCSLLERTAIMVSWADLLAFIAVALALIGVLLNVVMIYIMLRVPPPIPSKGKGKKHK